MGKTFIGIKLHKGQVDIVNKINKANATINIMCCSRQFGKSILLSQLILMNAINNKETKSLYCGPIYAHAKTMYNIIYEGIAESGVVRKANKSELSIILINGSTIEFKGVENYDNLRRLSIDFMYLDEFQFFKSEAWTSSLRPMLSSKQNIKCYIASTPRSKVSQFYDLFVMGQNQDDPYYFSIKKTWRENPLANIREIEEARRSTPDHIFKAEYEAEFIPGGGEVFSNLDEVAILDSFQNYDSKESYYAGIDLGQIDDFTVLTILNSKKEIVFIYRDNQIEYKTISNNILKYLKQYNVEKCLIETNVERSVMEYLYSELGGIVVGQWTGNNKQSMIENLAVAFQNKEIKILSRNFFPILYNECCVFTYEYNAKTRNIKYAAKSGFHDDCILSLSIALDCYKQFYREFKPIMLGKYERKGDMYY